MKGKRPKKRAKETTLNDLGEMMSFVVERMATKDDIAAVRDEMATSFADVRKDIADIKIDIAGIHEELKDIKARLKEIEATVENHAGYSKEIDHALERIAAIERHLGISSGRQKNASR